MPCNNFFDLSCKANFFPKNLTNKSLFLTEVYQIAIYKF